MFSALEFARRVDDAVEDEVMWEEDVREDDERERLCGGSKPEDVIEAEESGLVPSSVPVLGVDCSGRVSSDSSFMSMFHILTVWSAEQVARSLMSGERSRRVR